MTLARCPGCGLERPVEDGPTHRYIESSPACWRLYGEVLAREYGDPEYGIVHRLSVDAYAAQHPGQPSPQSIRSVAVHLICLCLVLERGWPPERVTRGLGAAVQRTRDAFRWLEPPASRGAVTIADVHAANTARTHDTLVHRWATAVWDAWQPHHATVRAWAPGASDTRP